jgi:hypothetical protein
MAGATYRCVKKSQIRAGFAMKSDKAGILALHTEFEALDARLTDAGVLRVQFVEGWVSEVAGNGAKCLELVSPPVAHSPTPEVTEPEPSPTILGREGEKERDISPPPISLLDYTCVKKSQVRCGFEMESDKASIMEVGTRLTALETRANEAGVLRVRFEGGWISEFAGNGAKCLEVASPEVAAPEPVPREPAPVVITVALEDCPLGEWKCLKKSQVRAGAALDSAKAGLLQCNERIDVLEVVALDNGMVRCRFADGWVGVQASNGDRILERALERSGESLKCGECTLDKEAYDVCMKMSKSSRLKNVAIIMKIVPDSMEIVLVDRFEDYTPEDIAEELEEYPNSPRYVMYMYEFKRADGRVTYPLCFIWYNPSGCDIKLNMIYGQTTEKLTTLLAASRIFNVQNCEEITTEWLHDEVNRTSGVKN